MAISFEKTVNSRLDSVLPHIRADILRLFEYILPF